MLAFWLPGAHFRRAARASSYVLAFWLPGAATATLSQAFDVVPGPIAQVET